MGAKFPITLCHGHRSAAARAGVICIRQPACSMPIKNGVASMSYERFDHHKPDVFEQQVISAQGKALRIVAPAGSGKTETLVRRVIERTGPGGIDPRRVLMLTFDNNGQQSFRRLLKQLAPRQNLPKFQTFNKFGIGILQSYFVEENSQIVKEQELLPFRRQIGILPILNWDERPRDLIETFRALKDQGYRPIEADRKDASRWLRTKYLELPLTGQSMDLLGGRVEIRTESSRAIDQQVAQLFSAYLLYETELRQRSRMDFQDQKLRPLIRLVRNKKIVQQERQRYDEVIIDEAQDISRLDALLIWHVIGEQTTITLAGDDDQTIYEFKQSSSVFLRNAAKYFEREFETFQLNINYRSPEAILAPAQALIAHNVERIEKTATASRSDPGEVVVHAATSDANRAEEIVRWIAALPERGQKHHGGPISWQEIAILAPSSHHLDVFARLLHQQHIPSKFNTGRNDDGTSINAIELSTIHRAKGRQWRVVVLPMSSEGEMPSLQGVRQGNLEAERRAYYVSMSRASDVLYAAYVRTVGQDTIRRSASGEVTGTSGASRFLFEAALVQEWQPEIAVPVAEDVVASTAVAMETNGTAVVEPAPLVKTAGPSQSTVPSLVDRLRQRDQDARLRIGRVGSAPASGEVPGVPIIEAVLERPITVSPIESSDDAGGRGARRAEGAAKASNLDVHPAFSVTRASDWAYVDKAERNLEQEDYRYALFDAWEPIFQMIRRFDDGGDGPKADAFDLINSLSDRHLFDDQWIGRLHAWRKTRNRGMKEGRYDAVAITDMVNGTREFLVLADGVHKELRYPTSDPAPFPITARVVVQSSPPVVFAPTPALVSVARSSPPTQPPARGSAAVLPLPPPPTPSALLPASLPAPLLTVIPTSLAAVSTPTIPVSSAVATPAHATPIARPRSKLHPLSTDRLTQILGFLSRGGVDPDTKQPIRSITFHTVNDGIEFLPLQLGLILYDIRFLVPGEYRYLSNPLFARFCAQQCPIGLPAAVTHSLKTPNSGHISEFEPRMLELMNEALTAYCTTFGVNPKARGDVLLARLQDADALHNGDSPRGIHLVPAAFVTAARPD